MDDDMTEDQIREAAKADLRMSFRRGFEDCRREIRNAIEPDWELYWKTRLQLLVVTEAALPAEMDALG